MLYISAEPHSTDGFLGVTQVNAFAPAFPNTCDISMGFFPENLCCFTMGLCLRKAVFLKGLWPAFCACATLGNLLPLQWEMGMTCQHFAAKDVCVYIFSVCVCIK